MAPAPHILVITYPAQSHINPALHFARRLALTGARVTFTSTLFAHRRMIKPPTSDILSYAPFSDGYDDGFDFSKEGEQFMANLSQVGPRALSDLMRTLARDSSPVTCVVYTMLLSWAADVARDMAIPSSLLWIQPATVFAIYYHYFHGYDKIISEINKSPSSTIELPGLPLVTYQELPSFLRPFDPYPFILATVKALFQTLDREENPQVLVNTFNALEGDVLRAVDAVQMVGIGPLIPKPGVSKSMDYVEWMDSQPRASVVYVSFGTLSVLSKQQMEEISNGLAGTGRPFLWVVRESDKAPAIEPEIRGRVRVRGEGVVVDWCSQVDVLLHPSVGCFVTHCGWNSTMEGLGAGVPMVCFAQWSDQLMNANMVEEVWKTGVRVEVKEDGVLEGGELQRCLEVVMGGGERGGEMRRNAVKWREIAKEALGEGGTSDKNIKTFVEKVKAKGLC